MSKKRKTKKEKVRTAIRLSHVQPINTIPTSPIYAIQPSASNYVQEKMASVVSLSPTHYAYVTRDMKKTLFITSVLLSLGLIFHFFLKNNFLHLGFFGY